MAITEETVAFSEDRLAEIQRQLGDLGIDGWLLYEFRDSNPISREVLGLPVLTRRVFVLLPARGRPVAITHRIEQQPWRNWIGENRPYLSWRSLEQELQRLLAGSGTIAVDYSARDAVPYVDRLPAGIFELIQSAAGV